MGLKFFDGRISVVLVVLTALGAVLWANKYWAYSTTFIDMAPGNGSQMTFVYVPGYFDHDRQPTGPDKGFRATTLPEFGIIQRSYGLTESDELDLTQWQRFERHIKHLNAAAPSQSQYRVLFVARHGEGVHNVKEREVGRHDWEAYWARLEGDGNRTWLDASLTARGEQQATKLGAFWRQAIELSKVPSPQKFYTSPLTRCLQTARLTFADLPPSPKSLSKPVVREALREIHGVHTCDKRSSLTRIRSLFPSFEVEPGFAEQDELWQHDRRETLEERVPVIHHFLAELFRDTNATFISLTTHTGAIRALYKAIGHPDVWVSAGAVVPIVVHMEAIQ